ncbi:MAG TPA: hypothetical protein DEF27_05045, partial [Oscillatoriales bacterium UBA8482]|nr:hypothetical protein [Oscillatoriales bacterium UBA8482]
MPQEKEELFQNKYRIRSYRHQVWDYGDYGWYYVTICTKNRKIFFGNVETHCNASLHQKPKMILSPIGEIIKQCWLETPIIRKNILLDEFIIMP